MYFFQGGQNFFFDKLEKFSIFSKRKKEKKKGKKERKERKKERKGNSLVFFSRRSDQFIRKFLYKIYEGFSFKVPSLTPP